MEHQAARVPESTYDDLNRNDTLLGHDGAIDEIETYNLDDDLLDALLDPMAPIDFGKFDLNQITGIAQDISSSEGEFIHAGTCFQVFTALGALKHLTKILITKIARDFGIVPIEPIRDGMVPQLQHLFQTNALPLPQSPVITITTGFPSLPPSAVSGPKEPPPALVPKLDIVKPITKVAMKAMEDEEMETTEEMPSLRSGRRQRQTKNKTSERGKNVFEDFRKREDIIARWCEKKARRNFNRPKVLYESRSRSALIKSRVNGKFVKPDVYKAYLKVQEQAAKHQSLQTVSVNLECQF